MQLSSTILEALPLVYLYPKCGLCYEDLNLGDTIVVGYGQRHITTYQDNWIVVILNDTQYLTCRCCSNVQCEDIEGHEYGSHHECYQHLPPDTYAHFLRVSNRWFESFQPGEQFLSTLILRRQAAASLALAEYPEWVAWELAQHLSREYAMASLVSLFNHQHESRSMDEQMHFDVSAPFHQEHVRFQGRAYLRRIQRTHGPRCKTPPKLLGVLTDGLGIIHLSICHSNTPPSMPPTPGLWWRIMALKEDDHEVTLLHDGCKIRSVVYENEDIRRRPLWSIPVVQETMRMVPWMRDRPQRPARMIPFSYNTPQMTGLSVRCSGGPVAWFSHAADAVDLSCYASGHDVWSEWRYIPLHEERIISIWRCSYRLTSDLGLVIETDKGKSYVIGLQSAPRKDMYLLERPNAQPSTFFFDCDPKSPRQLAFQGPSPPEHGLLPTIPRPCSPRPAYAVENFHWSSASLRGVTNIRQCIRLDRDATRVIGLLLEYHDGSKAALGQVRFDLLTGPQPTDRSERLWFELDRNEQGARWVSRVAISEEPPSGELCFGTRWGGVIEWWFTPYLSYLWYGHNGHTIWQPYPTYIWSFEYK